MIDKVTEVKKIAFKKITKQSEKQLESIAKLLGHSSIETTKIYTIILKKLKENE